MPSSKHYKPLSSIIRLDNLPEQVHFFKAPLSSFLENIFVKHLQINVSDRGSYVDVYTSLITFDKLSFEIVGTGLTLVLNPPEHDAQPGISEFVVSANIKKGILKILQDKSLLNFFQPWLVLSPTTQDPAN